LIKTPGLGLLVEGANRVVDNGAMSSINVLGTGLADRLPLGFVYQNVTFL